MFSVRHCSLIKGWRAENMGWSNKFGPLLGGVKHFLIPPVGGQNNFGHILFWHFFNVPQAWEWSICKIEKHPNPCWNLAFQDKDQNFIFWQIWRKWWGTVIQYSTSASSEDKVWETSVQMSLERLYYKDCCEK